MPVERILNNCFSWWTRRCERGREREGGTDLKDSCEASPLRLIAPLSELEFLLCTYISSVPWESYFLRLCQLNRYSIVLLLGYFRSNGELNSLCVITFARTPLGLAIVIDFNFFQRSLDRILLEASSFETGDWN